MGEPEQPGGSNDTLTHAHHRASDTRLDRPAAVVVPVVLPQAVATVDDDGDVRIVLDQLDHDEGIECPGGPIGRGELGAVLASIAEQIGGPVRVEVREPDGSRYADILQPRTPEPDTGEGPAQNENAADDAALLEGGGFVPGETVLVAVVATTTRADEHGAASLTDAPKLPRQPGEVVLLGSASGTVVRGDLPNRAGRPGRWWRR